jgi:hypothetical protein
MRVFGECVVGLLLWAPLLAQQAPDSAFRFPIPTPAFTAGAGPVVCIDGGHHNFHTMDGRYLAFAHLLQDDGYRVRAYEDRFGEGALRECHVVVIANAVAEANAEDWTHPHASAFANEEISALLDWIRGGGALLLIADHAPFAGAAADLALLLGVQVFDGYVGAGVFGERDDEALGRTAEQYGASVEDLRRSYPELGDLGSHVILRGRRPEETIATVVTFTGQAFQPARGVEPLLVLGPAAEGMTPFGANGGTGAQGVASSRFPLGGWLQGAAVRVSEGRVVVLGEAATCTSQLVGPQRLPMGMSVPFARQNAQFCLNIVRWLTGVLNE